MANDVVEVLKRATHRQHYAPPQCLGDTASALTDVAPDGVGLLKFRGAGVENQRLPARQFVMEHGGEPSKPSLGHASRLTRCDLFGGVIVDVKVLGLEHLEVEVLILNLVPAEVLRLQGCCDQDNRGEEQPRQTAANTEQTKHVGEWTADMG